MTGLRSALPVLLLALLSPAAPAQSGPKVDRPCEVVILGVDHIYYGEGYRAAHLRAFFDAVRPTAMGIENPAGFQAVDRIAENIRAAAGCGAGPGVGGAVAAADLKLIFLLATDDLVRLSHPSAVHLRRRALFALALIHDLAQYVKGLL